MIVFVYGTSAEAIKIAPLARRLETLGIPYEQWLTMFHGDSLLSSVKRLGFTTPDHVIPNGNGGKSIGSPWQTVKWLFSTLFWIIRHRSNIKKRLGKNSIIIVHGDTLTTVLGTVYAKFLGLPSAHVEAGLRSGNWRHPFPEELDRRIAGHLATIHYVPSLDAVENLSTKTNVVYTHGNTVIDAVLDVESSKPFDSEKYGVCLLHRFEFLGNEALVRQTLSTIAEHTTIPIRVYLDDYSSSMMAATIDELDSVNLLPQRKLPYSEFIQTLQHADFVLTDSGGIQAECALLGLPTLIHRKATEQHEGVGENILLSMWNMATLEDFLANYVTYKRNKQVPAISPTQVILDDLGSRGYLVGKA